MAGLALALAACAQDLHYEHLFTIGAREGIRPSQRFTGRFGLLVFGPPERMSPLVSPDSVAVDPEERIWITDRGSAAVHVFDVLHNRYKLLRGAGKTAFQCPAGIASDGHGRMYVVDACLGQVFVFESSGEFDRLLFKNRRPLKQPAGIAVSADLKSVYVADPPAGKVIVFNQEGESVKEWGGFEMPTAVALDSERILVLDTGRRRVLAFTPGGAPAGTLAWDQVRRPSALAYDATRRLFLVGDPDYAAVQVFNEGGFAVSAFGQGGEAAGELRVPASIHIDDKQRIYVADPLGARVLVFHAAEGGSVKPAAEVER